MKKIVCVVMTVAFLTPYLYSNCGKMESAPYWTPEPENCQGVHSKCHVGRFCKWFYENGHVGHCVDCPS